MKLKTFFLILLSSLAIAQVQDTSASGCPLSISGTYSAAMVTNNSQKEVLGYALMVPSLNHRIQHDSYFKPHGLLAGTSDHSYNLWPEATTQNGNQPLPANVTFVQFVDGSTWGDSATVDFLALRQILIQNFSDLTALAANGGDVKTYMTGNRYLSALLQTYNAQGMTALQAAIADKLANAAAHDKKLSGK